jgi:hypothetical protein
MLVSLDTTVVAKFSGRTTHLPVALSFELRNGSSVEPCHVFIQTAGSSSVKVREILRVQVVDVALHDQGLSPVPRANAATVAIDATFSYC